MCQLLNKLAALTRVNMHLACSPAILLLDVHPREIKASLKDLYTNVHGSFIHKIQNVLQQGNG